MLTRRSLVALSVACLSIAPAVAGPISVPNASFESPVIRDVPYATMLISDWQKAPVPGWWTMWGYTELQWLQTAGVFYNVPPPAPTWIDNVDGQQAAFMFATPGVELFQDLPATFEVGFSYALTVGFMGGGQGMLLGVPIEIRLYYRDDDDNRVIVGSAEFQNITDQSLPDYARHLEDCMLELPVVEPGDPWAGRNIGVQIISTVSFDEAGGFWRVDNVRLTAEAVPEPASMVVLTAGLAALAVRRAGRRSRR